MDNKDAATAISNLAKEWRKNATKDQLAKEMMLDESKELMAISRLVAANNIADALKRIDNMDCHVQNELSDELMDYLRSNG